MNLLFLTLAAKIPTTIPFSKNRRIKSSNNCDYSIMITNNQCVNEKISDTNGESLVDQQNIFNNFTMHQVAQIR